MRVQCVTKLLIDGSINKVLDFFFAGNQQQQPSTNLPVTPTKPRFFQPICPSPTPPIPPPPKNYTVDYKHAKYYSSDSAIDSPDLSGNSITMTTNDDLDELSKLDQLGLNLHAPHGRYYQKKKQYTIC